ncbi:MAG: DUF5916 domain-containing protein [Acidobacteriota bacterium]
MKRCKPATQPSHDPRGHTALAAVVAPVLLAILAPGLSAAASAPVLETGRTGGKIHLDGVLDEPAWTQAGVIPDLVQKEPRPGQSTPYETEVRVLRDSENLYIGVTCADPEPESIAVHTLLRDGRMDGDDTISIVLDTFGDGRNGFFFQVNASGARQDGLVSPPASLSLDWDGIWNARTHRSSSGWSLEVVIPARSLRFTPSLAAWGFNVRRFVARDRITLHWAGATLDAAFLDLKRAGSLEGVGDLEQGLGLDVTPFATARGSGGFGPQDSSSRGVTGVDATYNVTPELAGVLTVNPEFGETEADSRQVNLTRFSLFFPEKRQFFTQGSNLFRFGSGLGTNFIPFFSRRVGLVNGEVAPIDAGVKLLGRAGRVGVAGLDVTTRDSNAAAGTNLAAARVTYDVDTHLRLGMIGTEGDPNGTSRNHFLGFDAAWVTSTFRGNKNLEFDAWAGASGGDLPAGRDSGWGLRVDYPNDLWDLSARFDDFGDALDPALGFLPRPGTRQTRLGAAFKPRPPGPALDWIRQFFFEARFSMVENLQGQTESWRLFTAPLNIVMEPGDHFEVNWSPQFEHLSAPFEISPGVIIPPGSYHFTRYRAQSQSARTRPWRVGSTVWFGDFFDGRLTQWGKFVNWTSPTSRLRLELNLEDDFGALPEGNFAKRLWQLKTTYSFNPDLSITSFMQFDSDSTTAGMNNRLRWIVRPGNDLFVVWNRNWEHPIGSDRFALRPLSDEVIVKLVWTFRG